MTSCASWQITADSILPPGIRVVLQRFPCIQGVQPFGGKVRGSGGNAGPMCWSRGEGVAVGLIRHKIHNDDGDVIVDTLLAQRPASGG